MALRGTDPESYITEHTSVYEDYTRSTTIVPEDVGSLRREALAAERHLPRENPLLKITTHTLKITTHTLEITTHTLKLLHTR